MLKINRLKKIKSNFPVLVGDKVVEKNTCNSLIDEISKSKAFDDMIMGGRSRIKKGSKILITILNLQIIQQNYLNFLI